MKLPVNLGTTQVGGRFLLEAVRPDGARRVLGGGWFDNLITDPGLNRMGTGPFVGWCQVGNSSTAPAVTDTALYGLVGATSAVQASAVGTSPSAPYYGFSRRTFRFPTGAAAGNLTEVGVGWAASGSLFSRSLIKDAFGDPTTVVVLSDEVLDVTYEFRAYAAADSAPFNVTISGTVYTLVARAAAVTENTWWSPALSTVGPVFPFGSLHGYAGYDGSIGAVTAFPSGASASPSSVTAAAYANNSLEQLITVFWDLDNGNLPGFLSSLLCASNIGTYQFSVTPDIEKTATKRLTLTFKISWARRT